MQAKPENMLVLLLKRGGRGQFCFHISPRCAQRYCRKCRHEADASAIAFLSPGSGDFAGIQEANLQNLLKHLRAMVTSVNYHYTTSSDFCQNTQLDIRSRAFKVQANLQCHINSNFSISGDIANRPLKIKPSTVAEANVCVKHLLYVICNITQESKNMTICSHYIKSSWNPRQTSVSFPN